MTETFIIYFHGYILQCKLERYYSDVISLTKFGALNITVYHREKRLAV